MTNADRFMTTRTKKKKKATNVFPESWKNFYQMYVNCTGLSKETALTFHTFIAIGRFLLPSRLPETQT